MPDNINTETMTEEQLANLSDEELMGMAIPPRMAEEPPAEEPKRASEEASSEDQDNGKDEDYEDEGKAEKEDKGEEDETENGDDGDEENQGSASDDGPEFSETSDSGNETKSPEEEPEKKSDEASKKSSEAEDAPVDYKALYEQVMAPFKANGKEIKLESPEEVVQLMQMGANYTKKLQALQPRLKMVRMLENNGLMDEGEISFLIDLKKRNPAAIQKLLKDGNIDPMEIDTTAEANYKPGGYQVSDEEMRFTSTLEEVTSIQEGKEIVWNINKTWDKPSKEALWSDPEILRVLTEQKKNGIYDRISSEIERRRLLGKVGSSTPFLQAYREIGTELQEKGELTPLAEAARQNSPTRSEEKPASRVVETRPARSKPPNTQNNERARATSPTKSTAPKTVADFNPLALSDEEFEKNEALARRL